MPRAALAIQRQKAPRRVLCGLTRVPSRKMPTAQRGAILVHAVSASKTFRSFQPIGGFTGFDKMAIVAA